MVKTISSKVSDPRPRINIQLASDDERTTAVLTGGFVNVQRGVKTAILRMPYGEMDNLIDLLVASRDALSKHGYSTNETAAEAVEAVDVPDDASSISQHNPFAHSA